jgi:hypothetical protein
MSVGGIAFTISAYSRGGKMRHILGLSASGVLALIFVFASRADDADQARAIVDKAIKAMGGEEKLAKFKTHTWSAKGTYYGMGDGVPFTANYAVSFPDKFRFEVEGFMIVVLNGDKGWRQMMGETHELDKEDSANQKVELYTGKVASLLPLADKAFTLALLGESKVEGKPAVGVKVTHKDRPEVKLYFDKENGLLVKSEIKTKAAEEGNKEVNQESIYGNYQQVDGAWLAGKVTILRDGKKFVEAENSNWKTAEKLDDKVFSKP